MADVKQEKAQSIAIEVFTWLLGNDELLGIFMGASGASIDDLRARAAEPEFLGSVLDFVLMDDAWVVAVADAHGWAYTDLMAARAGLPGGGEVHWT
ncbi:MAG: DUF3572 domain-containing protein [Pseudomonadota bacterium]